MVDRFRLEKESDNPLPLVFSNEEWSCAALVPDTASALCAAFTFKEAVFKAIGAPFDPRLVQWMAGDQPGSGEAVLAPEVMREFKIAGVDVRILFPDPGECVTIVHVFGG